MIRQRTFEERESYIDGWNRCYETFKEYIERGVPIERVMEIMEIHNNTVNSVRGRKEE